MARMATGPGEALPHEGEGCAAVTEAVCRIAETRPPLGWTIAFGLFVVSLFFTKMGAELSRVWLAVWYVAGATALIGERLILSTLTRGWMREGRLYRRAVLYGANDVSSEVIAELETVAIGGRDPILKTGWG